MMMTADKLQLTTEVHFLSAAEERHVIRFRQPLGLQFPLLYMRDSSPFTHILPPSTPLLLP